MSLRHKPGSNRTTCQSMLIPLLVSAISLVGSMLIIYVSEAWLNEVRSHELVNKELATFIYPHVVHIGIAFGILIAVSWSSIIGSRAWFGLSTMAVLGALCLHFWQTYEGHNNGYKFTERELLMIPLLCMSAISFSSSASFTYLIGTGLNIFNFEARNRFICAITLIILTGCEGFTHLTKYHVTIIENGEFSSLTLSLSTVAGILSTSSLILNLMNKETKTCYLDFISAPVFPNSCIVDSSSRRLFNASAAFTEFECNHHRAGNRKACFAAAALALSIGLGPLYMYSSAFVENSSTGETFAMSFDTWVDAWLWRYLLAAIPTAGQIIYPTPRRRYHILCAAVSFSVVAVLYTQLYLQDVDRAIKDLYYFPVVAVVVMWLGVIPSLLGTMLEGASWYSRRSLSAVTAILVSISTLIMSTCDTYTTSNYLVMVYPTAAVLISVAAIVYKETTNEFAFDGPYNFFLEALADREIPLYLVELGSLRIEDSRFDDQLV